MQPTIQYLDWDSRFFDQRCARLLGQDLGEGELSRMLEQAREAHLDCLYYLADPAAPAGIRLLEAAGFHLVDVRLTFEIQPLAESKVNSSPSQSGLSLQPASEDQIPDLRQIALDSYENTRFLNDPCFDRTRARELYAVWIENSVRGFADQVLVALYDGQVAGFISMHLPADSAPGTIGLVGVAETARGLGIGGQLVHRALDWFQQRNVTTVQVVTQASNRPAQRLYQRAGFSLVSTGLWYHKWFEKDC